MHSISDAALDARARRAAKRVGLYARKRRGGYMLVDPFLNAVVRGGAFELSAHDVFEICRSY